ncbi:MAG TPA: hypothetical protein VLA02_01605 [Reyranella sp.]|nr:hypothetical protein [Reyranella sp.]
MPRQFLALFAVLSLMACSTQAEREAIFDNHLREMAGTSEAGLLKSMGRIPDNSYQLEDGTRILQWRWDTSYIDPGMSPMYMRWGGWGRGWGGGGWMPMGGFPPTLVRQSCIVEWTLVGSLAQGYRWQGAGCQKVTP